MKTVYTTGVFDILHPGHIKILRQARSYGNRLLVGVQEDESVFLQKGRYPAMSTKERMAVLQALPFVDECVSYGDLDQRPMIERLKPQVMVQTSEWKAQTNRSAIISYLRKNKIKLVLIPIKKTISSTQIKKRIIEQAVNFRDDVTLLQKNLAIAPISQLKLYERFDPKRVKRLVKRLKASQQFNNPIAVARYQGKYVVIDGANRLEALKRIKAQRAFVFLFDYDDETQVELKSNIHFLQITKINLERLLAKVSIALNPINKDEAIRDLSANHASVIVVIDGQYYRLRSQKKELRGIDLINAVVDSYLDIKIVYRLSEFSQNINVCNTQILFRRFAIKEIVALAESSKFLASGVTWHQLKQNIVRFKVALPLLSSKIRLSQAQIMLAKEIEKKISGQDIRYHPSNIYICDEWS